MGLDLAGRTKRRKWNLYGCVNLTGKSVRQLAMKVKLNFSFFRFYKLISNIELLSVSYCQS